MRVLLTGATGFVGRHVLPALAEAGHDVHAVSSRQGGPRDPRATWHQADVLQPLKVQSLLESVQADGMVHLAWHATPPDYWHSNLNLSWVAATVGLLEAFAANGGKRVVAVGTCAEYDWRYGYCTERFTPLCPATLYGRAKLATASVLEAYGNPGGMSAAWARLFFLFGPHEHSSRLVPSLVNDLLSSKPARCRSATAVRDFLHVDDAARAIVALFNSDVSGPVNIGSGVPIVTGALARGVAAQLGRPEFVETDNSTGEAPFVVANVQRLREEVGWVPSRSFEVALAEAVSWWSSHLQRGPVS